MSFAFGKKLWTFRPEWPTKLPWSLVKLVNRRTTRSLHQYQTSKAYREFSEVLLHMRQRCVLGRLTQQLFAPCFQQQKDLWSGFLISKPQFSIRGLLSNCFDPIVDLFEQGGVHHNILVSTCLKNRVQTLAVLVQVLEESLDTKWERQFITSAVCNGPSQIQSAIFFMVLILT